MTLRAKLVISFSLLLLGVIVAVGFVATESVRTILIGQIDHTITGFIDRGPGPRPGGPGPGDQDQEPALKPVAEVIVAPDGSVVDARPSGFTDDPDPLPDVSQVFGTKGFVFLPSVDGTMTYRAHVTTWVNGLTVVRAGPLRDVEAATSSLIRMLLLAGLGVLIAGGVVTWVFVDRSMQPVGDMVDTAEAIAAGDLTRRVPVTDTETELGRLGTSLNEMLTHLEDALTSEREGQDRLRQFVADASHELRTPVAAISGYAELKAKGGLENDADADRAWSRIGSESARMKALIEDLLVLARLGQTQPLELAQVDLTSLVGDAVADHRTIDPSRPIRSHLAGPIIVSGDELRLYQVISNLVANARVHTPPGTEVIISVAKDADEVVLTVADTGPGIPEDAIKHVFDRFYRTDPSRTRQSGGSGLGLSIVKAIIQAHGGTVTAHNRSGGGTQIVIRLPAV